MTTATVIGGGIGGTAAAIGLHRAGWTVEVFERATGLETSGAALGLWPTAMAALTELGVGDAVRAAATPQVSGSIRRPDGDRIATIDAERLRRRAGEPVHLVPRRDLASILAAALPEGVVRYGVEGRLDDHREAHVVIMADGVFSAGRAAVVGPGHAARYTGHTAWRGAVRVPADGVSETWGAGARFGVTPYRDGLTNWYASIEAPERDRRPGGELALLRATFAGWHDPIPQILDALTEADIMRHDLYDVWPPLPSYVRGNVALLGDAAHAMTPDLGRGACEALVDAVTLTRCLTSTVDLSAALADYDRQRRRATQRLASLAYRLSRLAHARRFTGLRDAAVRAATRFA